MSVNFYLGWKIMIETPIWLEKTDKKNSFKQLIKNFIFLENFDDDENKEIIIEEFKFKIDQIIQNEETIKKKEIKLEESQLINENKELKQPGKFRLKNFLIAVYLWIFNQVIFYLLLLNLDMLENHIPYSIEIFFICNILSNLFSQELSKMFGRKHILQVSSCFSGIFSFTIYYNFNGELAIWNSCIFFFFIITNFICGSCVYKYVELLFDSKSPYVFYSKLPSKLFLIFIPFLKVENDPFFLVISLFTILVPILLIYCKEIEKSREN